MSCIINGSAGLTTNSGAVYDGISRGTAVASTSGTSIDFTSIPSWVKRITVMLSGVSTNGTSIIQVQLGAGSVTTSGYSYTCAGIAGVVSTSTASTGFILNNAISEAAAIVSGNMIITNISSNSWVGSHSVQGRTNGAATGGGSISLGGTLDRIRITTVNGTDTFDAGSINIMYE